MLCEILVLKIIFTCIYSSVFKLEERDGEPTRTAGVGGGILFTVERRPE